MVACQTGPYFLFIFLSLLCQFNHLFRRLLYNEERLSVDHVARSILTTQDTLMREKKSNQKKSTMTLIAVQTVSRRAPAPFCSRYKNLIIKKVYIKDKLKEVV